MLQNQAGLVRYLGKEVKPQFRYGFQPSADGGQCCEMEFMTPGFGDAEWQRIAAWMCQLMADPEGPTRLQIRVLGLPLQLRPLQFRLSCAQLGLSREQCNRINRTLNRRLRIEGLFQLKIKLELA